jgi:hypothetical protein
MGQHADKLPTEKTRTAELTRMLARGPAPMDHMCEPWIINGGGAKKCPARPAPRCPARSARAARHS